jgi:type IV pilus assembly protein PilN
LIKINLVREGRAVRGGGAAAAPAVAAAAAAGPANINNILILALLGIGLALAGIWYFIENGKLKDRQEQVASKQAEAQKLESIIKDVESYQKRKESLQKRIDLINQLKQNQKGPVRVMDRISQDLPDLVWLDHMSMGGGGISLTGRGLNPNAIANFIDNIKNDPMFEEPEVGSLTLVSANPLIYSFDMSFHFSYTPKAPAAGAPGAPAATTTGGATATSTTGTTTTTTTTGTAAPGTPGGKKP